MVSFPSLTQFSKTLQSNLPQHSFDCACGDSQSSFPNLAQIWKNLLKNTYRTEPNKTIKKGCWIRKEKKVENYLGMLHLTYAFITFRAADIPFWYPDRLLLPIWKNNYMVEIEEQAKALKYKRRKLIETTFQKLNLDYQNFCTV